MRVILEALPHQEVLVAIWVVVHGRDHLEAMPGVERGSLECESGEDDLTTTSTERFPLRGVQQLRAESVSTPRVLDPQLADFQTAAPRVAAEAGNDPTGVVSDQHRQPLTIGDARDVRVELVKAARTL